MVVLRSIAQSAPRAISRIAFASARRSSPILRTLPKAQASWMSPVRKSAAAFSTYPRRLADQPNNDELLAKLDSEIRVESDLRTPAEQPPPQIQDYLDASSWQLHDEAGSQEVRLSKSFGDENIEISFSVADISSLADSQNADTDAGYDDVDGAYDDNEPPVRTEGQSGGATTKGAINTGRTAGGNLRVEPEDRVAPADRPELVSDEEGFEDEEQASAQNFPVRLLIKVTRGGQKGALEVEALAEDGDVIVENVFFYPTADLADPQSGEGEFKRRLVYGGPRYDNLDPDLQGLMDQFLADRGINTELSNWLPDFVDWKEQKEYVRWLNNVKDFLS